MLFCGYALRRPVSDLPAQRIANSLRSNSYPFLTPDCIERVPRLKSEGRGGKCKERTYKKTIVLYIL